jgi:hypothetical protein
VARVLDAQAGASKHQRRNPVRALARLLMPPPVRGAFRACFRVSIVARQRRQCSRAALMRPRGTLARLRVSNNSLLICLLGGNLTNMATKTKAVKTATKKAATKAAKKAAKPVKKAAAKKAAKKPAKKAK